MATPCCARLFWLRCVLAAAGLWLLGQQAVARPDLVMGEVTALVGSSERMISYRHQERMWQTGDGATHLLLNTGAGAGQPPLQLFTSQDNGRTWLPGPTLAGSGEASTGDVMPSGDRAELVYSTEIGTLVHATLAYDRGSRTWAVVDSAVAYASSAYAALSPAMADDAQGRRWLAFVRVSRVDAAATIGLVVKPGSEQAWQGTGLTFGPTDQQGIERSARPLRTRYGLGMVYTVHGETFWAHRRGDWPVNQAWNSQSIHVASGGAVDPFGSHYSAVVDDDDNVHLALVDSGRLLYLRRPASLPVWVKRVMTEPVQAAYVQTVLAGGHVMLVSNHATLLRVFQSADAGVSWSNSHVLLHAPAADGQSFARPRMEAPGRARWPVPVMQQFETDASQRLLVFAVDAAQPRGKRARR